MEHAFFGFLISVLGVESALFLKQDKLTCSGKLCALNCLSNGTHGCWQECKAKECRMQCSGRPFCWQICYPNRCKMIVSTKAKECTQICYGAVECPFLTCNQCKRCQQRIIYSKSVDFNRLSTLFCGPEVKRCSGYCTNQSCYFHFSGKNGEITAKNARVNVKVSAVVKRLRINCGGVKSLCLLFLQHPDINIQSECRVNCGTVRKIFVRQIPQVQSSRNLTTRTSLDAMVHLVLCLWFLSFHFLQ